MSVVLPQSRCWRQGVIPQVVLSNTCSWLILDLTMDIMPSLQVQRYCIATSHTVDRWGSDSAELHLQAWHLWRLRVVTLDLFRVWNIKTFLNVWCRKASYIWVRVVAFRLSPESVHVHVCVSAPLRPNEPIDGSDLYLTKASSVNIFYFRYWSLSTKKWNPQTICEKGRKAVSITLKIVTIVSAPNLVCSTI